MGDALTRLADAVETGTATEADFDATWPRAMYGEHYYAKEAYNGSLDAAKALHEAVLSQSTTFTIVQRYGGGFHCRLFDYVERVRHGGSRWFLEVGAWNNNPARAWLLAILRALAQVQQ